MDVACAHYCCGELDVDSIDGTYLSRLPVLGIICTLQQLQLRPVIIAKPYRKQIRKAIICIVN